MRINWRVRFRNPLFLAQLLLAVGTPLLAYYGLTVQDLTSWGGLGAVLWDALRNPYVLGTMFVGLYNALPDPTTEGLKDSRQVMRYHRPKKEGTKRED